MHYAMTATPTSNANVTVDVRVWYQSMPRGGSHRCSTFRTAPSRRFQALFEDQGARLNW